MINSDALTRSIALRDRTKEIAKLLSHGRNAEAMHELNLVIQEAMTMRDVLRADLPLSELSLRGQRNST